MVVKDFSQLKVAVLGAGVESAVTIPWLLQQGTTDLTICDSNPDAELKALDRLAGSEDFINWQRGAEYLENLQDFDLIVRSPGIPWLSPQIQSALQAGVSVTSHIKLFFERCPAPIIGVSGTKGKGTTAGLITAMLKAEGKSVYLGGNIGTPPLGFLDQLTAKDWVVLELSSFQLQDLGCSPHIAVITNLGEDHLDHHADLAEYHAAKQSLLRYQPSDDTAILNGDDPVIPRFAEGLGEAARQIFSGVTFDEHVAAGVANGFIMVRHNEQEKAVGPVSDIIIPGPHNLRNVLAACLAARAAGVSYQAMHQAIQEYRGLPHHLELVGEIDGAQYFDDSYAANPTATIPALQSFDRPIVLIAGGFERGLDYQPLAEAIRRSPVKAVLTIGESGGRLAEVLKSTASEAAISVVAIPSKEEIVATARQYAKPGDIVLFSPAAASFDMFENYTRRGEYFTAQVRAAADSAT